jgi:hypothetical protein
MRPRGTAWGATTDNFILVHDGVATFNFVDGREIITGDDLAWEYYCSGGSQYIYLNELEKGVWEGSVG